MHFLGFLLSQLKHANSAIGNNNDTRQYAKGQFVVVKFDGPNYSSPTIISAHKSKHPILGTKENFDQSRPYVIDALVEPLEQNFSNIRATMVALMLLLMQIKFLRMVRVRRVLISVVIVDLSHLTLVHLLAIS